MTALIPNIKELIATVDETIMSEIRDEMTGLMLGLYHFFDDFAKPLSAREFIEFWASCSVDERVYYLNPGSRHMGTITLTVHEEMLIRSVAENMFQVTDLSWWGEVSE